MDRKPDFYLKIFILKKVFYHHKTSYIQKYDFRPQDVESDCIATFCKAIDELLNGGVQLGRLTELTGAPGSGKSQLWYLTFI